jgi:hypothetical protein
VVKRLLPILLLLVSSVLSAAEIVIKAPTTPLNPGNAVLLQIGGITKDEMKASALTIDPAAGAMAVKLFDADEQPMLFFSGMTPGKYTLKLTLNEWRNGLSKAVQVANVARVNDPAIKQIADLVATLETKYPSAVGSCVLEVAGIVPPPIDPDKPVDPSLKVTRATYIYEKDNNTIPRAVVKALQQLNADGSGIVATEFEQNTTDGNGEVPDQYKIALEAAKKAGLPCLIVQAGDTVKKTVKDPKTTAEVLEACK